MMRLVCVIGLMFVCLAGSGQSSIAPHLLQVTGNKTTSLVFPAAISSIDRGSERIVVQKSTGNVLRVKADSVFADTTNLTIITSDGKLYSFLVCYSASPLRLTIDLGSAERVDRDTALVALASSIIPVRNSLHGLKFVSGKVRLSVSGVFSNGEIILCKLKLDNNSSISFESGRARAYVTGTVKGKRRSVQDREIDILLAQEECPVIKEKQSCILVLVIPKAGLATGQAIQIEIQEKGGERHLRITIPNKHILNATLINR